MPLYVKFLYAIWLAVPLFFFLMALWAKLEQISKSAKRQNPGDFMRQGTFVLFCVFAAMAIDQYLLVPSISPSLPSWLPAAFLQVLLLPVILLMAARSLGGTKPIKIKKAPRPTQRKTDW